MKKIKVRYIWSTPSNVDHRGKRFHWEVRIFKDTRFAIGDRGVSYLVNARCLDTGAKTSATTHTTKHKAAERMQQLAEVIGGYIKTIVDEAPGFTRIVRRTL